MQIVDAVSTYFYGLTYVVILVAIFIAISGFDDLVIDLTYWARTILRRLTVYRRFARADKALLISVPERPLALMIPAWKERDVIGKMVHHAAGNLDYENYHIFVGTYPNDPDTQADVDAVCRQFPNVHKVICARPGPTSKADCLNNVLDAIRQFEKKAGLLFHGFVLHDAEDIMSPMELRLFNYLVDRKDLIQIPVYPLKRNWYDFIGLHYIDEFTELHAKDLIVREALVGQVPSAGVGTCFSRRAIEVLLAEGDGIAFDTQSLTEDYDISFRLQRHGLKEVFVRYSILEMLKPAWEKSHDVGQTQRDVSIICVREFFPNTMATVIRQKSRWIIGIVFQGYMTHGWTSNWALNYFLWRDRKGILTNFFSFAANLILFQVLAIWLYQVYWPGAYQFLSIFGQSELLINLLWINFFLMLNRMLQRFIFVTQFYGVWQGLLSTPRMLLGNFINFLANWRAIAQVIKHGNPYRVSWDKTSHDFPMIGEVSRAHHMIGQILTRQGTLSTEQLRQALLDRPTGLRLGTWLVHSERITPLQLAHGIAQQFDLSCKSIDAWAVKQDVIDLVPAHIALHYAVFPVSHDGTTLYLASESAISMVALAAIERQLGMKIKYFIALIGEVTVGLRHQYARIKHGNPREELDQAIRAGQLEPHERQRTWDYYVSRQVTLGEILQSLGRIDTAVFSAVLLQHARTILPLGEFLVDRKIISRQTLDDAIKLQSELQPTMQMSINQSTKSSVSPESTKVCK